MRFWAVLAMAAVALTACKGKDDGSVDDSDSSSDSDPVDTNPWFGDTNGATVPTRAADEVIAGELSTGATMDLAWANSGGMACFPGTENVNFNGNHVLYEFTQAPDKTIYARVRPPQLKDLSIYGLQVVPTETGWPPNLGSAVACEATFDQTNDDNPGTAEALKLGGWTDYRVVIGVAGANHTADASFTLEIWYEPRS